LLAERGEGIPFLAKPIPYALSSTFSCVKMGIAECSRLMTPIDEEGVFLDLEKKRRVFRFIPEKRKLWCRGKLYL